MKTNLELQERRQEEREGSEVGGFTVDGGERWGEGWENGVTEEGRRDRSESEGIYVDGSGMQVKRSEGAGGEAWNVITMKRYGGESVSLSGDETLRCGSPMYTLTFFRNSSAQIRALALRVIFISLISLSISSIN